jgi:4-hydroxyphenylpyruvate dioxygenase
VDFQPWDNPMGTAGFEFVEYAAPDPQALGALFEQMGFSAIARHRHKDVTLYRQGDINFIINAEPDSFAQRFARKHGPSICAIALRVEDAAYAYQRALSLGAWGFDHKAGPMELNIPAIKGIGDSLIYLVDRWRGKDLNPPAPLAPLPEEEGNVDRPTGEYRIGDISIYDADFAAIPGAPVNPAGYGLTYIDHLTHNVHRGSMREWAEFYETLFNFREIRYFDIEGKLTGLKSKAMTSPCGKIRIPINESSDDKSQIAEYLAQYHGEGIQHIALGTDDIYKTVAQMLARGVSFQDTIDTYYDLVDKRLPNHGEHLDDLRRLRILIDGSSDADRRELLLQIFTKNVIGPIFFEVIQRKGDQGFGEGNFRALFESIELDQIKRGVLKENT